MGPFVHACRFLPSLRRIRLVAGLFPAGALAGGIFVAPTDLDFGGVFAGEMASAPVFVVNVSNVPQTPDYAGGAPLDPINFGGSQNCGGRTLPPGGSCAFTYVFQPASAGPKNSSTNIGIDGTNYTITMAGTGLFPITLDRLFVNFGRVETGDVRERVVTVTNVSGVPQTPEYAGGAPLDPINFGGSQNCGGRTLPPAGHCEFTYSFQPASTGVQVTTTTITVDGRNFGVTLLGYATDDTVFANGFD
jgi:hypothetical protein